MRSAFVEEPCKSALNRVAGMDFKWSLNPYTGCAHRCTFCYVRGFERRADRPSDDRYGATVRVKINLPQVLEAELSRPSWMRETVVIGAATDPYQPAEGRYRLTRSSLERLAAHRNPLGIITRGPMIVRDIDVLQDAARRAEVRVNFSVPTLDPDVWRKTEPGTAPPRQRLRALSALAAAGIPVGVGIAPVLPGISDRPGQLEAVVKAAREAGATRLWAIPLNLRPGVREHFMAHLARDWPEALADYERRYARNAYLPASVHRALSDQIAVFKRRHPVQSRGAPIAPPPEPEQLDLAI